MYKIELSAKVTVPAHDPCNWADEESCLNPDKLTWPEIW